MGSHAIITNTPDDDGTFDTKFYHPQGIFLVRVLGGNQAIDLLALRHFLPVTRTYPDITAWILATSGTVGPDAISVTTHLNRPLFLYDEHGLTTWLRQLSRPDLESRVLQ